MHIEFYLTTAMEVSHYAPIVRALIDHGVDAVFVNERKGPKTTITGWDDPDTIDDCAYRTDLPLKKLCNRNSDAVITIQPEVCVQYYKGLKIRMQYGVGLVAPEKPPVIHGGPFDYHFVHGPFGQANIPSLYRPVRQGRLE